jgi:hypothetical protein
VRKRKANNLAAAEAFRIPDAGQVFSIGGSVIFAAIKKGELVASKLGDAPRSPVIVTRKAVEEWIKKRRIRVNAKHPRPRLDD